MAMINIPVKGSQTIEFDTDTIMDEGYPAEGLLEIILQGVKHFANSGMADIKLTGLKGAELEKAQAVIMGKAQENMAKILRGEIRITGGKGKSKAKGIERAV